MTLKEQCKSLKLGHVPKIYLEVPFNDREQYLTSVFAAELEVRRAKKVAALIKKAGFPIQKTLEAFNWEPVTLPTATSISGLTELAFLNHHENILALGAEVPVKPIWPLPWGYRLA